MAGNAQYWYAETFRIRQLYTDAASAYLEGYQKYPKSEKAPINLTSKKSSKKDTEILPGSSQPQDLGSISYKDNSTSDTTQKIQSVETTATIITETFQAEEKILPDVSESEQYEFATSFLKVGDYPTAERAFREFVISNPDHKLAGNAQYWYAETFRIRQLYTDAASAYLEGYQKYPKGEKAPINLLKPVSYTHLRAHET